MAKVKMPLFIEQKKAAIYIRVSTQYQVDRASLPVQREELINYAKYAMDIDKYEVFEDAGYSGKNMDRPAYQQMMARVRIGEFSHILVWKIDRISRNLLDFAGMYAELKKLGVTFVSKNEQFDTSSAMGEAMLKIILVFAELERNMTSERVTAVMISRANDGQWNGGRTPFGYDYDKETGTFSINEDEAKVVRLIYDLYEQERSLIKVAQILNDRGLHQRSGISWSPNTVRSILISPFYVGTMRYNYRQEGAKSFSFKPESEWVMVEAHHDGIVDQERQKEVIDILRNKQRGFPGANLYQRKNTHIFAGLLVCDFCGSNMSAMVDRERADGWKPSKYICTRHRRFNDCPNKYISDVVLGPFAFNYIANMIRASNSFGKTTSIETLEKKLLRGEVFSDVDHIGKQGLEDLYNLLRAGIGIAEYRQPANLDDEVSKERDLLLSERRRLERALNRLKSLYLYSEDTMSESDYIIERNSLTDSLESVCSRLDEIDATAGTTSMSDNEFISKASYFIMAQNLLNRRYVDYESFVRHIDPVIPKNFISSIVQNFCIRDGKVVSILFKNGIQHQFFYKAD